MAKKTNSAYTIDINITQAGTDLGSSGPWAILVVGPQAYVTYLVVCLKSVKVCPWRASVSSHQDQCNIPTFEALLRKYKYLFLERCRKSNNVWLRALMQSDCLYSSIFIEHYNRILLCDWVIELHSVRSIDGMSSHNAFSFYLDWTKLGINALLRSSAVTSVTC